ncbi:hypothetical protein H0H87_005849 [Tephrocybe sp. NHM501043]|nr:hypothetical protein H0H87_005849 [Tephrocybe sp. NHM501043]
MANTDKEPSGLSQLTVTEAKLPTLESLAGSEEEAQDGKEAEPSFKTVVAVNAEKLTSTVSSTAKASTTNAVRPSLVQLGSGTVHHSTTAQPKRFSAVNINKKFLEKNASASASSPISQPTSKAGGTSALVRPQTQSTTSHSRLVTTKLTSTSPASSTSGAGWSRPSSVAPQNTTGPHSPNHNSPPLPTTSLATTPSTTGAPQLPHAGKVIQPQPRSVSALPGLSQKDSAGSTKPVWGNLKSTAAPKVMDVRNDFPTAAEVAQVASSLRAAKLNDSREAAESAAASKQARMEEADTFRGVHLDPNAHHWDENQSLEGAKLLQMEEDDDNFLDGVIEFGDGRQYKIDTSDMENTFTSTIDGRRASTSSSPTKGTAPDLPVSKEERFADDFDRSWPRSRTSPANSRDVSLPASHPTSHLPPVSPATSQEQQEAARVLFNERSNRLEPYSNGQRSTQGQISSKKGNWHDSPTEPRSAREFPPTPQSPNIQLLQKPGDQPSRFRRFSGTSTGSGGGFGPVNHNRDRDQLPRRDGPPPSPRLSKDSFGLTGREREPYSERGRRSDMGPPPIPPHATRGPSRDSGRQLPPHLSQLPATAPIRQERKLSRETRFPSHGRVSEPRETLPTQSPVLSQTSATCLSPAVPLTPLPLSTPEIDEARKDVMQSAAARAKQRRQQEEEEREKEKERARRKAAEIEERMKAAEAEKAIQEKVEAENAVKRQQEDIINIIEEAVKSVPPSTEPSTRTSLTSAPRRPRSLKELPDPTPLTPSTQLSASGSGNISIHHVPASSPAVKAESWRTKVNNTLPALPTSQPKSSVPSFATPFHVEPLADGAEEDLEVVDFLDMGKFVGVPDTSHSTRPQENANRRSRPVASDFFDESVSKEQPTSSTIPNVPQLLKTQEPLSDGKLLVSEQVRSEQPSGSAPAAPPKPPSSSDNQAILAPAQANSVRTPRNQSQYKEAAMSALDDAMSRIKGALDGMQAEEGTKDLAPPPSSDLNSSSFKTCHVAAAGKPNAPKERWIPPALRPRNFDYESREVFHITCTEAPQSPIPAWNAFTVKLPSVTSLSLEPISRRQMQAATKPTYQVRMDILSFDPPVEGMKKDLSLNDILFRKPVGGFRTNFKPRVRLPRARIGPRMNIPAQPPTFKTSSNGAFGRSSEADGMTTWRKQAETKPDLVDDNATTATALTGSSLHDADLIPTSEPSAPSKSDMPTLARPRVPKMPAGSAVAFYRDSRIDAVEEDPHTSVNFIVGSELETKQTTSPTGNQPSSASPPILPTLSPDTTRISSKTPINGLKAMADSPPSLMPSNVDSKSSDDSVSE